MDLRDDDIDARLKAAFPEALPDASKIQQSVRKWIAARRAMRWMAAAAAVALLAVVSYRFATRPSMFAELARDHHREVVEQQPRRWRTDPGELRSLIARYGVTPVMVSGFAPAGYRLEHAKTCLMAGRPVLHLVYTDGSHPFSVYVRRRTGAAFHSGSATVDSEQVSAVEGNGFEAAVVMIGSGAECLERAKRAASVL